jgi:DNA-directed RNA polymerase subunit RPC12/RpoP
MRKDSILSNEYKCFICGRDDIRLDVHHIYRGKNRQVSDENGFWVYLCNRCHIQIVHQHPDVDMQLKQACQTAFEKSQGRDAFRALIQGDFL